MSSTSIQEKLFLKLLENIPAGRLDLTLPGGQHHHFTGYTPGPAAQLHIRDRAMIRALLAQGGIGFAESYMRGEWESDDLCALLHFAATNAQALRKVAEASPLFKLLHLIGHRRRTNTRRTAPRNIHAHYDLGNDFYRLWLDESMTYSSALYADPAMSLSQAQQAKYGRILSRMGEEGGHVLEIGCGWGGFAEAAARLGRRVTALTISPAQAEYAQRRMQAQGIDTQAEIVIRDYREERGLFDHIVSIEMFEAVGERYWPAYFKTLASRLKEGGSALIQTITIADDVFPAYRKRCDFIQRHIFPGGMLPSKSVFEEKAREAGLRVQDAFAFGRDYARTLAEWLVRFDAAAPQVAALGFPPEFIRKWRFYLAYCHGGFAGGRTDVVQYELRHGV